MSDELVKRLREFARLKTGRLHPSRNEAFDEAADKIEDQEAELDRLRALLAIDDAAVERARDAIYGRAEWDLDDAEQAARAALKAAFPADRANAGGE